jgi:protein-L-isoaspartate(D-aspartate) O-methyltransferase
MSEPGPNPQRDALLSELARRVSDERVLDAIAAVPRDAFVPEELRQEAWENHPLPIGHGQTISQPLIVARMCELLELRGDERVLDVGTGRGYHAAVLAHLAREIVSVERDPALSRLAREALAAAGIGNVILIVGDGRAGHPPRAPYDAINVAAATAEIPSALTEQLADGGRMVIPTGGRRQWLVRLRRRGDALEQERLDEVRFVPLVEGAPTEAG